MSRKPPILWSFLVLAMVGCSREQPRATVWRIAGPTMGTTYSITISDPEKKLTSEPDLPSISAKAEQILADINRSMSTYDPQSEISTFNGSTFTEPMSISADFARVVHRAKEIHQKSQGAFDITVSPLVDLWGFGHRGERPNPPTEDEITRTLESVGSERLEVTLEPPALRKSIEGLRINLNAIAPGHAADRLGKLLDELGYQHYLIDVGGEFLARGKSDSGKSWRIAIERPDRSVLPKQTIQRVLSVADRAVATSGDYRQYFEFEGKFYSHTIDPKTGKPVIHSLASATIIADDAMSADGWATAVMVLGPEKGMQLIESLDNVEAVLLIRRDDGTFEEQASSGAQKMLVDAPTAP
jgi:thiamine biosynthesis lipoprotein